MTYGVIFHLEVEVSEHQVQNILFLKMLSKFALILSSVKKEGRQISLGFFFGGGGGGVNISYNNQGNCTYN